MHAAIAQSVERIHGKDEVPGSNPGRGSIFLHENTRPYGRDFCLALVRHLEIPCAIVNYAGSSRFNVLVEPFGILAREPYAAMRNILAERGIIVEYPLTLSPMR